MKLRSDRVFAYVQSLDSSWTREEYEALRGIFYYDEIREPTEALITQKMMYAAPALHRLRNLVRSNERAWQAGNCYRQGTEDWARTDGLPLTKVDIDAINDLSYGQSTGTAARPGDLVAHVRWECDSSD